TWKTGPEFGPEIYTTLTDAIMPLRPTLAAGRCAMLRTCSRSRALTRDKAKTAEEAEFTSRK
ncbi:hypothetical protein, partial [Vogesella fluminis]|uniref:hypothetical protein n=1 Tax=Vogesella fluminis TaxID=1069161 RepID=UPI001E36FABB